MRFAILALVLGLVAAPATAVDFSFQWAQPLPASNPIRGCSFGDAQHGLTVGDSGTILRTSDGGDTWNLVPDSWNVLPDLHDVLMLDGATAVAVGAGDRLYRSADGGRTWTPVGAPGSAELIHIARAGATAIVAVGDQGEVLRSADAGLTWTLLPFPGSDRLTRQHWFDASRGLVMSGDGLNFGTIIAQTDDGGQTWSTVPGIDPTFLINIAVLDDTTGFLVSFGQTYRTDDGGTTWADVGQFFPLYSDNVVFLDAQNWLVGANGEGAEIHRTVDGGASFSFVYDRLANVGVTRLLQIPGGRIVATMSSGTIATSDDDGLTWTHRLDDLADGWAPAFTALGLSPSGRAFAASDYPDGPDAVTTWYESTDHGESWHSGTAAPPYLNYSDIAFVDEQRVYATGYGVLLFNDVALSVDGGASWTMHSLGTGDRPYDLAITSPLRAYVTSVQNNAHGRVYRTDDGGESWQLASGNLPDSYPLRAIAFVDDDHGFVFADAVPGLLYTTTDAGASWQPVAAAGIGNHPRDLWFADVQHGLVRCFEGIFRTEDGGFSWEPVVSGSPVDHFEMTSSGRGGVLHFATGVVSWTDDGGATWQDVSVPWHGGYTLALDATGFVLAGVNAGIVRAYRNDATPVIEPTPRIAALVLQASPNPFNPQVALRLDLPRGGRTQVAVLDARGRLVRMLAVADLPAGPHTWTWDGSDDTGRALPSGVYLARAMTDAGAASRKLMLVR